jgi:hypothetical protein
MEDTEGRRIEDDSQAGVSEHHGAILTGLAAGTANAVATQAVNALRKKPKDDEGKT